MAEGEGKDSKKRHNSLVGRLQRRLTSEDIFAVCHRVSLDDLVDQPADESLSPESFIALAGLQLSVRRILRTLTPREERILRERALASTGEVRQSAGPPSGEVIPLRGRRRKKK